MAEYISREAVLEFVEPDARPFLAERIKSIPAADVREAKRGEWKRHHKKIDGVYSEWCVCSVCGQMATAGACYYDNETPFCPNCGADMREANE